jgi:hypothetical protein
MGRFLQTDPIGSKDDLNLYAYTGGVPLNNFDPGGREVVAVFNKTSGYLTVRDKKTGKIITVKAESGNKTYSGYFGNTEPIPNGVYDILEQRGRSDFLRLEKQDADYDNDRLDGGQGNGRNQFRLHGPGATVGCIAICSRPEHREVFEQIKGAKETAIKYGTLTFINPPPPPPNEKKR